MAMKRTLDEMSKAPVSELSKTERRRLAKQAKKQRQGMGGGGGGGGTPGKGGEGTPSQEKKKGPKAKVKMTKEERRAKYTQKAYEAREKQNQMGPGANKTRCLGCRAWGHIVANCPEAKNATGVCFNCGSSKHALRVCPQPRQEDGSLPHATCFVCGGKGHISANCKQNANGVYPKGGFCKVCGSKHHLSWDCPDSTRVDKKKVNISNNNNNNNKNNNSGRAVAADADVAGPDESNENREPASKEAREGGSGHGGKPERSRAGAAAGALGGVLAGRADENKPKLRKAESSVRGSARASTTRTGGDDLEDDGYFDAEDVPGAFFEADETDEQFGPSGGGGRSASGKGGIPGKKIRKASKVVVF